jgi:beta-lactam-binding protein with PASTA domain
MTFRSISCAATLLLLLVAVGCGSSSRRAAPVPDVTLEPLNAAEDTLDAHGLGYNAVGGGAFGIVVRSHWTVCKQVPEAGIRSRSVTLYVARACPATSQAIVPDAVGLRLNEAEDELERAGFQADEQSTNGDPVIVESLWTVCDQSPPAWSSSSDRTVELYVAHDCWTED